MLKKIFASFLALFFAGTVLADLADIGWSVVYDQTNDKTRVVSVIKKDQATPFSFGPVVFFGNRQTKLPADHEITKLEANFLAGGYVSVPAWHPGKQDEEWGIGSNTVTTQTMFAGGLDEFNALVEAGAGDGTEINFKGAAQTVISSALMAVGAVFSNQWLGVIGMTAAGNSSQFGIFVKDDPTFFKSVGDPPGGANQVVVLRTWIDRMDENDDWKRVVVYTTIFSDAELSKDRMAEQTVASYKPLLKPQQLTVKQREWLDRNGWANLKVR